MLMAIGGVMKEFFGGVAMVVLLLIVVFMVIGLLESMFKEPGGR